MEVDLNRGSQLIYVIPNIMMTIGDFFRNIQLSIATRGYETWQNGEVNLLITRGMIGRLSNTPNVAFAYEINGVVDYLTSHGIVAVPRRRYSTRQLQGMNWVIRPTNICIPMQPSKASSSNLLDDRISLSFSSYQATPIAQGPTYNNKDEEVASDEEELRSHIIAVLVEKQRLLVKWLVPSTILPKRATEGASGYDLAINRAQDIPVYGRSLLSTGLSIKTPEGTYARIAPRSGAAFRRGILIGAGVVDSDYRGEVQILAFNTTDQDIFLQKHESIAQIILEHISTLEVIEVNNLEDTIRGDHGFGSTSKQINELQHKLTTTWLQSIAMSFIPPEQRSTTSSPTGSSDARTWYNTIGIPETSTSQQSRCLSWQNIINTLCPPEETPTKLPEKRKEHAGPRFPSYDSYVGEAPPWPSIHRSIDYLIIEEEKFIAVLNMEDTNSEVESLQREVVAIAMVGLSMVSVAMEVAGAGTAIGMLWWLGGASPECGGSTECAWVRSMGREGHRGEKASTSAYCVGRGVMSKVGD
ncbi:hypothetical protein ZIOFF_071216 [Zingiber officinale]|uniref:dUTP diphosphatase n=1 Tax=Zingiber officinale TaxID=94328 RepID=A0A8J5EUC1_ZINOF|nr:hypothetical protein ZIOFF_071216 [Zingiber officinale]